VFELTKSLLQRENLVASNSQVRQVGHWVDFAKQKTDEEIPICVCFICSPHQSLSRQLLRWRSLGLNRFIRAYQFRYTQSTDKSKFEAIQTAKKIARTKRFLQFFITR